MIFRAYYSSEPFFVKLGQIQGKVTKFMSSKLLHFQLYCTKQWMLEGGKLFFENFQWFMRFLSLKIGPFKVKICILKTVCDLNYSSIWYGKSILKIIRNMWIQRFLIFWCWEIIVHKNMFQTNFMLQYL